MLERVQRRPLSSQHRPRIAGETHQHRAVAEAVAVLCQLFDFDLRIQCAKECSSEIEPGEDDGLPTVHLGGEARVGCDRRV